jgi:hypothetical protein
MPTPNALHSKKTPKWGTPQWIIERARDLLGEIHLDPASSPDFNRLVKALMIYTEVDNGLVQEWGGNIFLNPPGGLVPEFWDKLCKSVVDGQVEKAFWVGFSVEQLCQLSDHQYHPYDFSTVTLRKRLSFNTEILQPGPSPSHGNYLTAIGVDRTQFDKLFRSLGRVVHGHLAVDLSEASA